MTGVYASQRYGGGSYATAVAPWLGQGEHLLAVTEVSLGGLIRDTVPRRHRPQSGGGLDVLLLPFELVSAAWTALRRGLVAPLRGRPLRGGWGSQAGRFVIAVRTLPSRDGRTFSYGNDHALLAFTTHRVLIAHPGVSQTRYLGEFPRGELRGARNRHWTFSDRVDLTFADGSLVAVEAKRPEAEALARVVSP
jgi:hypothetical protein